MKKFDNYRKNLDVLRRSDQQDLNNEIIKQAYQYYPFIEEDVWLDMLSQRNNMAHIYNGNAAKELASEIIRRFIPAFEKLEKSICERYADLLDTL